MKLRWRQVYREAELYQAALKLYTKPLFQWRKALGCSIDGRTLYDFARRGLQHVAGIHQALSTESFQFRPSSARTYNFNGKIRTLYIAPWEEKLVDLLLYRLLSHCFHRVFSSASYAYRIGQYGVDLCQHRIARVTAIWPKPLFIFKRDIANYFDSIDHDILTSQLAEHVEPGDYLWRLLQERIRFSYERTGQEGQRCVAERGVPFGTPIACFFSNLYLTDLDRRLTQDHRLAYFRYADDLLGISSDADVVGRAAAMCDRCLTELRLTIKPDQRLLYVLSEAPVEQPPFAWAMKFKHLGLEFRATGCTGLSRDKARKLQNLFRYAFRRKAGRLRRLASPEQRAQLAVRIARSIVQESVRPVAILDYYLKHVRDETQLRGLDRWLAEEVLSMAFRNGHKKGNFKQLSFATLRAMGLPSLRHRSRLIRHGELQTSFFQWKAYQRSKATRGGWRQAHRAFSPSLEAAAETTS